MSVRVMSWVWEHSRSKGMDRLVLLAVADCAADDGGNAYPSMAKLIAKTGMTDRGIQKCFVRLIDLDELVVDRNKGPRGCNRYRVKMRQTPEQGSPPNSIHPERGSDTPEQGSPQPPNTVRGTPEPRSPGTVLEPSFEPSVEPSTLPGKPTTTRRTTDDDPDFAAFWKTYPRKTDKGHARTAWTSALKTTEPAVIAAGAELFAAQCARNRTEKRFIPHPATWLRGERWADEIDTAPAGRTNGHQPYRNPEDMSVYEEGL